jgi:hypothetical protein
MTVDQNKLANAIPVYDDGSKIGVINGGQNGNPPYISLARLANKQGQGYRDNDKIDDLIRIREALRESGWPGAEIRLSYRDSSGEWKTWPSVQLGLPSNAGGNAEVAKLQEQMAEQNRQFQQQLLAQQEQMLAVIAAINPEAAAAIKTGTPEPQAEPATPEVPATDSGDDIPF